MLHFILALYFYYSIVHEVLSRHLNMYNITFLNLAMLLLCQLNIKVFINNFNIKTRLLAEYIVPCSSLLCCLQQRTKKANEFQRMFCIKIIIIELASTVLKVRG